MKNKEILEIVRESFNLNPMVKDGVITVFEDKEKEYEALHTGVGIRFPSGIYVFKLKGIDALDFLHRITTNSIKDMVINETRKTIFTTDKGRILDSVLVIRREESLLLLGAIEKRDTISGWLQKYIIMDDVVTEDITEDYTVIEVGGGQLPSFANLLLGSKFTEQKVNFIEKYDSVLEGLSVIRREAKNGRVSLLLCFAHSLLAEVLNHLLAIREIFNFSFIGSEAAELYRIEQGIPEKGELTDDFNPHEVDLIHEVSFTKGCYIGQEVIARLDTYEKVQKNLTGITMANTVSITVPSAVFDDDNREIGKLTSLVKDMHAHYKGLAVLRKGYLQGDHELFILQEGRKHAIQVHSLPFRKLVT